MVALSLMPDRRLKPILGYKVAIVDSNAYSRGLMLELLRRTGLRDIMVLDNREALSRYCASFVAETIFIEHNSGALDLVRCIRRGETPLKRELPIVMTAACADAQLLEQVRQAGVDNFLLRPISAISLQERLEYVLRSERDFIDSPDYTGPCRRVGLDRQYDGPWRRAGDEVFLDKSADMEVLGPLLQELNEIAAEEDSQDKLLRLHETLEKNMGLVGQHGDSGVVRIFGAVRGYLQGAGSDVGEDNRFLDRFFHFAGAYMVADMSSREGMLDRVEELERRVQEAIESRS